MAAQHTPPVIEAVPEDGLNIAYDRSNEIYPIISQAAKARSPPREWKSEPRICGRRKVTFWLMVALAMTLVIIVAVVIVAGVEVSKHRTQREGKQYADYQRLASLQF